MRAITTLLFAFLYLSIFASTPSSIFDKLSFDEVVNVTIEVDTEILINERRNDEKHTAVLTYEDGSKVEQAWDIKVKIRGKYRRLKCAGIPPLKLYFDKDALANAGLAKYDDLKLVNYCEEDALVAKELLYKEYLAYKMYNEITEKSYRVQLLKITYKDSKSNQKFKQMAFLIEDTAQLRARINANKFDIKQGLDMNRLNPEQNQMVAMFEYMIGNSDWKLQTQKNVKIIEKDGQFLTIPYDFDFSGMVSANYATPNSNFDLTTLTDRVYLGDTKNVSTTIALFKGKKSAIVNVVKSTKLINNTVRKEMLDYIASFYENLTPVMIEHARPFQENKDEGLTSIGK